MTQANYEKEHAPILYKFIVYIIYFLYTNSPVQEVIDEVMAQNAEEEEDYSDYKVDSNIERQKQKVCLNSYSSSYLYQFHCRNPLD